MTEEQLLEIVDAARAALLTALANPKPKYKVDDIEVDWGSYLKSLKETIEWAELALNSLPSEEVTIYSDECIGRGNTCH